MNFKEDVISQALLPLTTLMPDVTSETLGLFIGVIDTEEPDPSKLEMLVGTVLFVAIGIGGPGLFRLAGIPSDPAVTFPTVTGCCLFIAVAPTLLMIGCVLALPSDDSDTGDDCRLRMDDVVCGFDSLDNAGS